MATMKINPDKEGLFLDPEKDKLEFEERIIKRIEELLPDSNHEEVVRAVETEYEEMLAHAKVKLHIPTLVEKVAKEDVRYHREPGDRD